MRRENRYCNPNLKCVSIADKLEDRRVLIEKELRYYVDNEIYCPAISSNVKILSKSVDETANWGCTSKVGTKLCLLITYVIEHAEVMSVGLPPDSNRQRKKFKFISMATLKCHVPYVGTAKLTVGYRKNGHVIEYCITEYTEKK